MQLVWPAPEYLRSYCDALIRGWSPNGGVLVEEFEKMASLGGGCELRFRILLRADPAPT